MIYHFYHVPIQSDIHDYSFWGKQKLNSPRGQMWLEMPLGKWRSVKDSAISCYDFMHMPLVFCSVCTHVSDQGAIVSSVAKWIRPCFLAIQRLTEIHSQCQWYFPSWICDLHTVPYLTYLILQSLVESAAFWSDQYWLWRSQN